MSTENHAASGSNLNPLRIVGIVVGALIMVVSLVGWFPYLGASLTGFDSTYSGPGVTNQQLIGMFFMLWIVPWLLGLGIVLVSIVGWLTRTRWILFGITGAMFLASFVTYSIGASSPAAGPS